jgi:tetratricopeptide (TPR) repeat protein
MRLLVALSLSLLLPALGRAQAGLALVLPATLQTPAAALLEQATRAARLIDDADAAGPAWAEIALAQALAGDVAGARRLTVQVRDDAWKAEILKSVGLAQVRRGDLSGAAATAAQIGEDDARAEVLLEIATVQMRSGDIPRARQSIAAARTALTSEYLGGLAPRMAFVRAAVGDLAGAQKALATASGDIDRALCSCELALGAILGGNPSVARQRLPVIHQQIEALGEGAPRSRALVRLTAVYAALGDTAEAVTAAERISDARGRTEAFLELAERGPRTGRRDAFRRAWSAAEGILQSVTRAVAWCRIAGVAEACGEGEDARALLRKAREAAEALTDPRDRVRALAAVVRAAPSGEGIGIAPTPVNTLSASFRTLALAGLKSPRPGFSLPSGPDRPYKLAEAALGLVSQVEPLAASRQGDVLSLKATLQRELKSLQDALVRGDSGDVERLLIRLIGTPTDSTSRLSELAQRLALEPQQVDSLDEERSYNAFLILKECLSALRPAPPLADPTRARISAALLDLRLSMAAASFGPAERESLFLTLSSGKLALSEVLARVDVWLSSDDSAGLDRLSLLLDETAQKLADDAALPERVRHPKILLSLGTLTERINAAKGR